LIINKNWGVAAIEDKHMRNRHRKEKISLKTFKTVIHKCIELVEQQIGFLKLEDKVGAVMYDGWSKNSIHYIGTMGIFMRSHVVRKQGGLTEYPEEQEIVLLSAAPMVDHAEDDDGKEKLEVSFSAQKQVDHFREIFKFYVVKFDEWCVCQIGDNASVNVKTAELCGKAHVGCKCHKLNLEVKAMRDADDNLTLTIEDINKLMVKLRTLKTPKR
jgi:hypothetical protein